MAKFKATDEQIRKMDLWWRAANYLAGAQLYLLDNPMLKEPLKSEDIKKKIVGHWGTVPGQNFIYTHLNRCIRDRTLFDVTPANDDVRRVMQQGR